MQAGQQLSARIVRFNNSGQVVTTDDLMRQGTKVAKVRGKSGWKCWTPGAIQKAAFAVGSGREIAQSFSETSARQRSHSHVRNCKKLVAMIIIDGQERGLRKLVHRSRKGEPLGFYITNPVFDETKLWYQIRGKGFKRFSTIAHHTHTDYMEGSVWN